jgi:hypothetical protein
MKKTLILYLFGDFLDLSFRPLRNCALEVELGGELVFWNLDE